MNQPAGCAAPMRQCRRVLVLFCRWLCVAWLASLSFGCDQDPLVVLRGADGGRDLRAPQPDACLPSEAGVEICDRKDNDCNGQIDEPFNTQIDPNNCGGCGNSCEQQGALTTCELGRCKFVGCAPGFVDLNGKTDDGCEHACTASGVEVCDGQDNDCNGQIDETFDLSTDVDNCGKCGKTCQLANAVVKCEAGSCKVQRCDPGFIDLDQKHDTGCEKACQPSNGGVEVCDNKDNDCNGVVDDPGGKPIDLTSDPLNCGACAKVCAFPNAKAACQASKCVFAGCQSPSVDADKDPSNGCECQPTGAEICDGKDNDCSGKADDGIAGLPGVCGTNTGECTAGVLTCTNGVEVCTGKVGPQAELCDGKDNDCNGQLNPAECRYAAAGREQRLDQLGSAQLGASNSAQLTVAGSGSRVLAAWIDRRSGGRSDIYANVSTDGGKTWSASDFGIATESNSKVEPRLAFGGPSGGSVRAYVAYGRFSSGQRDVYLRRSTNGGASFEAAVKVEKVSSASDALFISIGVKPGATSAAADTIVVCWERIATSGPLSPNVRCNISTDSGQSFGNDVQVNAVSNDAIVPKLAVDGNNAYVVWQQGTVIKTARAPLSAPLTFVDETSLSQGAGQEPEIAADGTGRVLVVWEDLRAPLINIRANRSVDSGKTWLGDGLRVDNDVVDGESTDPAIAVRPGGRMFVAWTDTNRGQADVYVNVSDDGGNSWSPVSHRVDAEAAGASTSAQATIAVAPSGNNVYLAWEDQRNGAEADIYFSLSLDNGITWNVPDYRIDESGAGLADARAVRLWANPARIAVVWLDNRSSNGSSGPNADVYASYVE